MKTTLEIHFDTTSMPDHKADTLLLAAGCEPDLAEVRPGVCWLEEDGSVYQSYEATLMLDAADERVAKIIALIQASGQKPSITHHVTYSEEELQTATLLKMRSGRNYLQSTALELGTKYDVKQACPHCGTGAKQVWYERVKRKELPLIRAHHAIRTLDGHIIVDAFVHKMLVDAEITGISFAEVHARDDFGDWKPIDRDQILIESTLPPMRGELTAKEEQKLCKVCRRGGHPLGSNKRHHKEDLAGMKDFNWTWEWFGFYSFNGVARSSYFSSPEILVTPKVMNVFREARVDFRWTPVEVR